MGVFGLRVRPADAALRRPSRGGEPGHGARAHRAPGRLAGDDVRSPAPARPPDRRSRRAGWVRSGVGLRRRSASAVEPGPLLARVADLNSDLPEQKRASSAPINAEALTNTLEL